MGMGKLIVNTYLAGDALPVEGVLIRVEATDEGESGVWYSRITDMDGVSAAIDLPAPPRGYSTSPGAANQPYSTYKVTAIKDGYYDKSVSGVSVFENVTTVLPINMIVKDTNSLPPEGTLESESYENPRLE